MLREVEQLMEEVRLSKTFADSTFFQTFLMAMNGQCNGLKEADKCFEPSDQSGATAVKLMLTVCLAAKNEPKMNDKLKLLLKTKIGESVANQIISKFSREGETLMAEYLYEIMTKLGCSVEDTASGTMISLCGKRKMLKQAQEIFAAATGSGTCGKVTYSSMVDAYVMCGREEEAYLFYKEQTERGHNLSPISISILVKALANCGKCSSAKDVIHNSFHDNLDLDTVAYNTFIKAMLEAGKLRFAIHIYKQMLFLNISPSIQTYNTMISVHGRGRNLHKAVEMFNMAEKMGLLLDEKTYTNLICHYGKAGKNLETSSLFSKMQEEGINPGQMSYNIMMNIYASEGLHHEAELFRKMLKNGCSPDLLTSLALIRAYTEGMKYLEAEKVIMSMQNEGIYPTCAHFNLLLLAITKSGSMREAERIYGKLLSAGLHPKPECKRIMLRGYLDYGHGEEGIVFFERECRSVKPDRLILSAADSKSRAKERGSSYCLLVMTLWLIQFTLKKYRLRLDGLPFIFKKSLDENSW